MKKSKKGELMKEVIEYIVKCLVENKDAVKVAIDESEQETIVRVSVAESDLGRVIGKNGKIASSIRTIARSLAKDRKKTFVKFGE